MDGLIMAGGFGSRVGFKPKGFDVVNGVVVIDNIYEKMRSVVDNLFILVNWVYAPIYVNWARDKDVTVIIEPSFSNDTKLGSVGGLKYFSSLRNWKNLLVVFVDNYFDFDLLDFVNYRGLNSSKVVLVKYDGDDIKNFGQVVLDENDVIIRVFEKSDEVFSNLVSTGIYYFAGVRNLVLDYSGGDDNFGSFIDWLSSQVYVWGFVVDGVWKDTGV